MKIKSNVKVGGPILQHNQTVAKQGMRVKSNIKAGPTGSGSYAGSTMLNHNQTVAKQGLRVKSNIKAGPGTGGIMLNHNQTVAKQGLRVKSNIKAVPELRDNAQPQPDGSAPDGITRSPNLSNHEVVAAQSPRLLYSATLGNSREDPRNPNGVAAVYRGA